MVADGPPASDPCLFCDIIAHRRPGYFVYEDDATVAFLDLYPLSRGHLLVVPRRHVDRLTDLAPADYAPVLRGLVEVCRRVGRLAADYNVGVNQGAAAGQIVFHLHFHVIPRYGEPSPFAPSSRTRLTEAEATDLIARLGRP